MTPHLEAKPAREKTLEQSLAPPSSDLKGFKRHYGHLGYQIHIRFASDNDLRPQGSAFLG